MDPILRAELDQKVRLHVLRQHPWEGVVKSWCLYVNSTLHSCIIINLLTDRDGAI